MSVRSEYLGFPDRAKVGKFCFSKAAFATVVWNEICRLQPMEGILDIRLGTRLQDEKIARPFVQLGYFSQYCVRDCWVLMGIGEG